MDPQTLTSRSDGNLENRIMDILKPYVGALIARSILDCVRNDTALEINALRDQDMPLFRAELEKGVRTFVTDLSKREECFNRLSEQLGDDGQAIVQKAQGGKITITGEYDIVTARGEARHVCERIGFPMPTQIKVATVVSELTRNIVQYAGSGEITFTVLEEPRPGIEIVAKDGGPGISNIDTILAGEYESKTGMGMGLFGTRNLMDEFDVKTDPDEGTTVTTRKYMI